MSLPNVRVATTLIVFCVAVFSFLLPNAATAVDREYTVDLVIGAQSPLGADRGRPFAYTVYLENKGPAAAQGVTVTTPVPMGLHFEREGSDGACTEDADENEVVCSYASLGVNQLRTIPIVFRTRHQDSCSDIEYVLQSMAESLSTDAFPLSDTSVPVRVWIRCVPVPPQCDDGMDNDHDLLTDMEDPGCLSSTQDDERRDQRGGVRERGTVRSSSSSSSPSAGLPPASPAPEPAARPQARGIRVSVRAGRGMVQPGETVPVTILVHNRSSRSAETVTLRFTYDPRQLSVTGLQWGIHRGAGTAEWTLDIQPDQTRRVTLDATVLADVPPGSSVVASARAEGHPDAPIASLVLPVAVQLPQTGGGQFTARVESASRFLTPIGHGGSLAFLLMSVAVAGAWGGTVTLARRASRSR